MPITGSCKVIGGTMQFKSLTNLITEQNYEIGKIFSWHSILRDGGRPVKWGKPTHKGTSCKFETFKDEADAQTAKGEFEGYLDYINQKYGTDFELQKPE